MADYPNDEYSDEEEWQDNFLEEQRDAWDESGGAYPIQKKPDSLFSLFNNVWKSKDSTKVANIEPKLELGDLGISVRQCKKIAYASDILNESDVKNWFGQLGEITLSTSMSKKGWFTELFVSTKKFAQKGNIDNFKGAEGNKKWRLFGGKKETANQEQ
jgi:hypothetical protein